MNIQPLLDALDIQEEAARALADDLRTQIAELQNRLREAETQLEHLAITRKTVTALTERIPPTRSRPTCPSTRTIPTSSPSSTRPPAPYGPVTSAKPLTK
ncbi:hypothetical protein [Streptomyces atratus]|uniref:hypothetical protein n=1 Tax=Streptomyces atratus TaxID=1893 RepID=UPI00379F1E2D